MTELDKKVVYCGYKGINLDSFSLDRLTGFNSFIKTLPNNYYSDTLLDGIDTISFDEVKRITREIMDKYFSLSDVYTIDLSKVGTSVTVDEETLDCFYDVINKMLSLSSPYDININLTDATCVEGSLEKPLILTDIDGLLTSDKRKIYYSNINLGKQLNKMSSATYAHELAHAEQEKNIGYCDDLLHKEIISFFIEKLVASEIDPSGNLLKIEEKVRMDTIVGFNSICSNMKSLISPEDYVTNLMYIKSYLIANKLFDMYLSERKQKNRDKYIDDIQRVFDGKIKVEEMINSRNISLNKCQDLMLLKRHS